MIIDKKTIGLTTENKLLVQNIINKGQFKDQMDVAKFAMSYAINVGVSIGYAEGTDTIWNVGSFDSDGEIKTIIQAIYPDTEVPYRTAEYLYNEGLKLIGRKLSQDENLDFLTLITVSE